MSVCVFGVRWGRRRQGERGGALKIDNQPLSSHQYTDHLFVCSPGVNSRVIYLYLPTREYDVSVITAGA